MATGWLPGKLSAKGIEQTKALAAQLKDKKFDIVFCSDLTRAIDSAEILFGLKNTVIEDKRLRECNYGKMNGKSASKFKNNLEKYIDSPFPEGESYMDVEARINEFLEFLKKYYNGKQVAIVAHQAPQLALDVLVKGKSWKQAIDEDWRKTKDWKPGWEYQI